MGFYSEDAEDYGVNMDALIEAFLIDDLTHNYGQDTVQEFCTAGGVADVLVENKVLSTKATVNRMSKKDDFTRRYVITAIQMARAKHDPLYAKLVKYQMLRKQARAKIVEKYGTKAKKVALKAQKEYIKSMRNVNLTNSFTQAANSAVSDPNR